LCDPVTVANRQQRVRIAPHGSIGGAL